MHHRSTMLLAVGLITAATGMFALLVGIGWWPDLINPSLSVIWAGSIVAWVAFGHETVGRITHRMRTKRAARWNQPLTDDEPLDQQ